MRYKLAALVFLATVQTSALALQSNVATREELALLPPYCTAINGYLVGLPRFEDSPLRHTYPAGGCPTVHHYCYGLAAMNRADRYVGRDRAESGHWHSVALDNFQGLTREWESSAQNCSIRAEAHTNLGKVLLRRDSAGAAVANFIKALELQPTFLPAYYALSDYYLGIGKKRDALATVEQGLKYRPEAKGLLKRFKELGGTTLPEPIAKPAPEVPLQPDLASDRQQQAPAQALDDKPTAGAVPAPAAPNVAEPAKPQSSKNPYCRFCAE